MDGRELPVGWSVATVGELTDVGPKNECDDETVVGFVPLQRLGVSYLSRHTHEPRKWEEVKKGYTHFQNGDVLLARITPSFENGKAGIARDLPSGLGAGSTEYIVFRPLADALDPRYLLAHFKNRSFLTCGEMVMTGAVGQQRVPKSFVLESQLPLAPLNEQRRIAAKLDTTVVAVDACRQRLDGVAAILKRFRQAVLAAATSGELTREWREERDISQEAWKSIKTKDAGKIQLGRQRSPKYHQGPTMRPYLRVQNVFEDRIDLDDVMEMDFSGADLEKYALHPGDILLNEGQSPQYLGRPAMYRGELPGVCFTNSLIRFQASDSVLSEFALLVFRDSMHSGRYVEKGTITTNIAHLSAGRFGEVDFPLPPLAEQQEIVLRAQHLFSLADQLEARLTAARKVVDRLTPALLAKAFRGELVPQDPNDEPASVLLERIRAARQAEAGAGKPSRRGRPKAAANPDQLPLDAAPVPSDPLPPDLLTQLLQECGALSERALLAASELEPEGFFTQLARELRLGSIRQSREEGQVLLEAVS